MKTRSSVPLSSLSPASIAPRDLVDVLGYCFHAGVMSWFTAANLAHAQRRVTVLRAHLDASAGQAAQRRARAPRLRERRADAPAGTRSDDADGVPEVFEV